MFFLGLQIEGMTCASCVHLIESTMVEQQGIVSVAVALSTSKGRFTYDIEETGPRTIIASLMQLGFEASLLDLDSKGIELLEHKSMIKK